MKKIRLLILHAGLTYFFYITLGITGFLLFYTELGGLRHYLGVAYSFLALFAAPLISAKILSSLMRFDKKDAKFALIFGTAFLSVICISLFVTTDNVPLENKLVFIFAAICYFVGTLFLKPYEGGLKDTSVK